MNESPTRPHRDDTEHTLFFQTILVGGFIFIAFMLFALARSIYRDSFQVGSYISDLESRIAVEKQSKANEQEELAYAKTPQFQEKMAKEFLGLKSAGEEVIVLTNERQNPDDLLPDSTKKAVDERALLTAPQKWLRYLFEI